MTKLRAIYIEFADCRWICSVLKSKKLSCLDKMHQLSVTFFKTSTDTKNSHKRKKLFFFSFVFVVILRMQRKN